MQKIVIFLPSAERAHLILLWLKHLKVHLPSCVSIPILWNEAACA